LRVVGRGDGVECTAVSARVANGEVSLSIKREIDIRDREDAIFKR